jgi:hypothetical protein
MSNYTKSTNFAAKDALASGNAAKIVKGTEIDTEFNNIATAVATKADSYNPTFTGTVTIPSTVVPLSDGSTATTQSTTDSSTLVATTAFVKAALATMYPVGSIFTSTASTNPGTSLGFGTWVAFGAGRVMIGNGGGFTAGATGGSADAIVVSHTHTASTDTASLTGTLRNLEEPYGSASGIVSLSDVGQAFYGGSGSTAYNRQANINASHSHSVSVSAAGSSATNANLQPYVVVYMWNRTA